MKGAPPRRLAADIATLAGVGPRTAERLRRLGILRVADLLFHLPIRYEDRTRITPIGALEPRKQAVIQGRIDHAGVAFGRRRSLLVRVSDGTGAVILRFFHFSRAQQTSFERGRLIRCFGEARFGPSTLEMVHPTYELPAGDGRAAINETLTPIYTTTAGLHQQSLRKLTDHALALLDTDDIYRDDALDRLLGELPRRMQVFPALTTALRYVHRPPPDAAVDLLVTGRHPAQKRLALDELTAHQLSFRRLRAKMQRESSPVIRATDRIRNKLLRDLPFRLTSAQARVIAEIDADLARAHPMLRLLQGDVGAGKTIVAAVVAARVIGAGLQVALMAPTEILAEQHRRTFSRWLYRCGVEVITLIGRRPRAARGKILERLQTQAACFIVGTHALLQEDVSYRRIGLVIIDEQHRFGVDQRLALRDKGRFQQQVPHQLIMTATPIPRTLAMAAYADLDVSTLDELPPNRTPVKTAVIPDSRRAEVVARIAQACRKGRQVYWVCPLIEESEAVQCQSAIDSAAALREALPDLRVGLIHGRLKQREKDAAMRAFAAHDTDLLVATTVIEVGVDVPNASLMIIENAERLGLAQLHQLRGRVGRGATASDCVLMYRAPLSEVARARLKVMRETTDGFVIADRDLELRGPGEVLGTRQAGAAEYRIADLIRDADLLPAVRMLAERLAAAEDAIGDTLVGRWLGANLEYGSV
jgi:ATP-dependent DNA helicase RecG